MPSFTTSPAALRRLSRAGSLRTPSSLITPPTDTPTTNPDATPTTPTPTTPLTPLESDSIVAKAMRAYERDRQRTKRTKERAEREREREQRASEGRDGRTPCRQCRDGPTRKSAAAPLAPGALANAADADAVLAPVSLSQPCVEDIIADVVEREGRARGELGVSRPLEVHLGQLLKPGKMRRSKGERASCIPCTRPDAEPQRRFAAGEFELIPGMPTVIALDEHAAEDTELDEPWEHISADELDEKRVAPPSYATIVASTA
ncbi:hypothetical protein PYCCODRAFT_1436991 [Trametes coccinea BRFM310]|uniref:Uncharacterized protein n=1 Tax=Trametes coccinea (strain BRFM310) TaxID=1353009 RepID=A0A1Y2ILV6_TRAC3|nr:hypothetical protein PYCCODRAFT_1436991 [Trametes coccinea BRFM310]